MDGMHAGHRSASPRGKHGMRGVTLIELMVVVVILGILVSIAYPGYQSQMQRTRRTDGKAALVNAAQALERCFTRFSAYNNAGCDIVDDLADGIVSTEGWYVVTDTAPAANGFALVATPQDAQVDDTLCAALTLDSAGLRGADGTAPDTCW
jgi:type IV pilus assembly protein PilE